MQTVSLNHWGGALIHVNGTKCAASKRKTWRSRCIRESTEEGTIQLRPRMSCVGTKERSYFGESRLTLDIVRYVPRSWASDVERIYREITEEGVRQGLNVVDIRTRMNSLRHGC